MRIAHIKVALFAFVLLAPLLSLAALGAVEQYGNRDHPEFPSIDQMLRGKKGRLDQFGEALLHRSAAMKLAISVRSWVSYRLVGFVDTDLIVSGEDGWLFYRPEFGGGRCLNETAAADSLRRLAVLIDMGQAAGIDMIFSVSPDKSTIYPEMLNQRVRGYWRCRAQNVAALRRLIKQWAPAIIDHAEPILAEKQRHPEVALYDFGDTHWTPYGAALALRQLLERSFPGAAIPPAQFSGTAAPHDADLSHMLLLQLDDELAMLDQGREAELIALNRDPVGYRTAIVRDSFYGVIESQLQAIFPNGRVLPLNFDDDLSSAEIAKADRLIVNVVERTLLARLRRGELASDAPLAIAIIRRNMERAGACTGMTKIATEALPAATLVEDAPADDGNAGMTIAIPTGSPGRLPCLRLTLVAQKSGTLTIALPDPNSHAFESGHEFKYQITPAEPVVSFVLPDYVAGGRIRLEVEARKHPIELKMIETGDVGRPDSLSAGEAQP